MDWAQIADAWRQDLVDQLQENYGLAEEEARKKAELWLEWLSRQPTLKREPIHTFVNAGDHPCRPPIAHKQMLDLSTDQKDIHREYPIIASRL